MLDRRILRKHGVVPLRVEEGHLVVATSSPSNFYMLEDLAMLSGYPITPVVALQEDIERVLNRVFTIKQEVAEIFEGDGAGPTEVEPEIELGVEARPDEAPIIRLVTALLQRAVTEGASDIHVEPRPGELMVRFRVDGVLREAMSVPPGLRAGMVSRLKIMADLNIAEKRVPQDGRFSVKLNGQKIDFRVASLPTAYGEKVVLQAARHGRRGGGSAEARLRAEGLRALSRPSSAGLTGPSWSRGRPARASPRRSTPPSESSTPRRRTS